MRSDLEAFETLNPLGHFGYRWLTLPCSTGHLDKCLPLDLSTVPGLPTHCLPQLSLLLNTGTHVSGSFCLLIRLLGILVYQYSECRMHSNLGCNLASPLSFVKVHLRRVCCARPLCPLTRLSSSICALSESVLPSHGVSSGGRSSYISLSVYIGSPLWAGTPQEFCY
ncbi:hypothetical protein VTK56DRAFT_605 [Thermocarpiscus australiensis]